MVERVSLRDMVSFDKIEDILTSLFARIAQQDQAIAVLQQQCNEKASNEVVRKFTADQLSAFNILSDRLDKVHSASYVTIGNSEVTAGSLAKLHNTQLQQQMEILSDCVLKVEFDQCIQDLSSSTNQQVQDLYEWSAPASQVRELETAQGHYSARLQHHEMAVAEKVDKSDVAHVFALAQRLDQFAEFCDSIEKKTGEMGEVLHHACGELEQQGELLSNVTEQAHTFSTELSKCANKEETRALAKQSEQFAVDISNCVKTGDWEQWTLVNLQYNEQSSKDHQQLEQKLSSLQAVSALSLSETKASIQDIRNTHVLRSHFDEMMCLMGNNMDNTSQHQATEVVDIRKHIQGCETSLADLDVQMDVVTRFVKWFTTRGENYEYNMKLIDKHLSHLATDAASLPLAAPPTTFGTAPYRASGAASGRRTTASTTSDPDAFTEERSKGAANVDVSRLYPSTAAVNFSRGLDVPASIHSGAAAADEGPALTQADSFDVTQLNTPTHQVRQSLLEEAAALRQAFGSPSNSSIASSVAMPSTRGWSDDRDLDHDTPPPPL